MDRGVHLFGCVFKGNLFFPNALLFLSVLTVVWCLPSEVEGSQLFLGCPSWTVWTETLITAAQVRVAHRDSALGNTSLLSHSTIGLRPHMKQGEQVSGRVGNQPSWKHTDGTVRMLTCPCVVTLLFTNLCCCIKGFSCFHFCWLLVPCVLLGYLLSVDLV